MGSFRTHYSVRVRADGYRVPWNTYRYGKIYEYSLFVCLFSVYRSFGIGTCRIRLIHRPASNTRPSGFAPWFVAYIRGSFASPFTITMLLASNGTSLNTCSVRPATSPACGHTKTIGKKERSGEAGKKKERRKEQPAYSTV